MQELGRKPLRPRPANPLPNDQPLGSFQSLGLKAAQQLARPLEDSSRFQQQRALVLKDLGQQLGHLGKSRADTSVANYIAPALIRTSQEERRLQLEEQKPLIQAAQSEQSLMAQKQMQTREQEFQAGQQELERQFRQGTLDTQQSFQEKQNLLQRQHELGYLTTQQLHQAQQQNLDRQVQMKSLAQNRELFFEGWEQTKEKMQSEQDFQMILEATRHANEIGTLDHRQSFDKEMQLVDQAFRQGIINQEQAFQAAENMANRALQKELQEARLAFQQRQADAEAEGGLWGALGGIAGSLLGPAGAAVGSALGDWVGDQL